MGIPRIFGSSSPVASRDGRTRRAIGVANGAIGGPERVASLAGLFPDMQFEVIEPDEVAGSANRFHLMIVAASASSTPEMTELSRLLREKSAGARLVVVLRDADVTTTRRLVREGAADVLPAPVSEAALALSLERLLNETGGGGEARAGETVALLKAGGGVGATSLCAQLAMRLAASEPGGVCMADLDLQFGAGHIYLDLPDAITLIDCLGSGTSLADTPYAQALAQHRSGARLLASSHEITALETLSPSLVEAMVRGLKRDFRLTLIDLPSAWTAWTNQVLAMADHIVLVTQLSVPHVQLVRRQLRVLGAQGLDAKPLTLVCNALSQEQAASVSVKAAERAIGRDFDVVIPEDRKSMLAAINEGVELSRVRRGSKVEKGLEALALRLTEPVEPIGLRR